MKLSRDPVVRRYRLQYLDTDGRWRFLCSKLATSVDEAITEAFAQYGKTLTTKDRIRLERAT